MGSEDDGKQLRKKALNNLLDYFDEDPDNSRERELQSLIFGNNSFVSFVRGMKYNDNMTSRNESTPVNFKHNKRSFSDVNSLDESQIVADSEFLDSEAGKQLILKDQISHEKLFKQGSDCTGCSSWTPVSRKNVSSISIELSNLKQKHSVSVGEFMGIFSENVNFTGNQTKHNPFANCFTSTPKEKRKSRSMSSLLDMEGAELSNTALNLDLLKRNESLCMLATPTSIKPINFSTPKWTENDNFSGDFHYYIGSTARKNIQRLKNEERKRQLLAETLSFNSQEEDKTAIEKSNGSSASGYDDTTYALRTDTSTKTSDASAFKSTVSTLTCGSLSNSHNEMWFVQPQSILLDPQKGNRVQLVNNSSKNLRFKTMLDSRMTNVCPLSGTVPAMDNIGLRILISSYAKRRQESFESDIKVIIGKTQKIISVKFVKDGKSKFLKERSYILF